MATKDAMAAGKVRSITLLTLAVLGALSLWFVSAAILPAMLLETEIAPWRQAMLSSGVQLGFVAGALTSSILGLPDRIDPRRVFAVSAIAAGLANLLLLGLEPGAWASIAVRFATGALLAGVYPVGMKIVIGWGLKDRGLLVGILIGALTLGSALPHLVALSGGADWRWTITVASFAAIAAGLLVLATGLGPHHATAARFDPTVIQTAWTNRRVRLAYAGYLGHMWELYAMWAWIGVAAAASYRKVMPLADAEQFGVLTAFLVIGVGAVACVPAGLVADRIGKARVAQAAMVVSGCSAIAAAIAFGGPAWIVFAVFLLWGISIVPDSAQFSGLVADAARPEQAGSLLTLQTALGFALTFVTVQAVPPLVAATSWPFVLALMALGPLFGVIAMTRLMRIK